MRIRIYILFIIIIIKFNLKYIKRIYLTVDSEILDASALFELNIIKSIFTSVFRIYAEYK